MATFTFNKTKVRDIQNAIANAPKDFEVYWQPTHHAGCVQVIKLKPGTRTATEYCVNTFCTQRTGYQKFVRDTMLMQDCMKMPDDWIAVLKRHNGPIKFKSTVHIKQRTISHIMEALR